MLGMISCKQASLLSTKKAEGKLTFKERVLLFIHVKMCEVCRLFDKQNKFISVHAKQQGKVEVFKELSEQDKRELVRKLEEHSN